MYQVVIRTNTASAESSSVEQKGSEIRLDGQLALFRRNLAASASGGAERVSADRDTRLTLTSTVLVLAVPPSFTIDDLCTLRGLQRTSLLKCRRIVDLQSQQHSLLLTLKDDAAASEFVNRWDGSYFSMRSIAEVQVCHMLFVSKVQVISLSAPVPSIPLHFSLPSCARCVERLDASVSGIVTHRLSAWQHHQCTVCQAVRLRERLSGHRDFGLDPDAPSSSFDRLSLSTPRPIVPLDPKESAALIKQTACQTCGYSGDAKQTKESLWICLSCGHIGCGRSQNGHAHAHFQLSKHRFTLEIDEHFIWDYEGDGYVHRVRKDDNIEFLLDDVDGDMPYSIATGSAGPSNGSLNCLLTGGLPASASSGTDISGRRGLESGGVPLKLVASSKGGSTGALTGAKGAMPAGAGAASSWYDADDDLSMMKGRDMDPMGDGGDSGDEEERQELEAAKLQSAVAHYTALLNSQLQVQCEYWEQRIASVDQSYHHKMEMLQGAIQSHKETVSKLVPQVPLLEKELKAAQHKRTALQTKVVSKRKEVDFLRALESTLTGDLDSKTPTAAARAGSHADKGSAAAASSGTGAAVSDNSETKTPAQGSPAGATAGGKVDVGGVLLDPEEAAIVNEHPLLVEKDKLIRTLQRKVEKLRLELTGGS